MHGGPGEGRRKVIRVAVVDENDIYRRGLVACLESDDALLVVFAARTGPLPPLVDVVFASMKAATGLARDGPPWLICGDPHASGTGVTGCADTVLSRDGLTEEQVLAAARAAASGLRIQMVGPLRPRRDSPFPQRMLEVLRLLADGCGTREISERIGFSERTVKSVVCEAQRRLTARSRSQAVAEAIRRGLI